MAHDFERIVIVTRKTELEELVERFNTVPQARFYLTQAGQDFDRIEKEHDTYANVVRQVKDALPHGVKNHVVGRHILPQYTFSSDDLVVVIGQDGLVSNTAKYLDGQMVMGVNPNSELYDGVLLPFAADTFEDALNEVLKGLGREKKVTMAEAKASDGQRLLAFNDFFIGARTHVSARYEIEWNGQSELQSSSGIIISTGAGSTGWMRSIQRGAANVMRARGLAGADADELLLPWESRELMFAVREPFPSQATGTDVSYGLIKSEAPLRVRSKMPVNGIIFSDGIEADNIVFTSGLEVTVSISDKQAHLVF